MDSQTAQLDDIRLVAIDSAVNCTDIFVRFTLAEWALHALRDRTSDAARTIVRAVVTESDPRSPGMITVRLWLRGNYLGIDVETARIGRALPRSAAGLPIEVNQLRGGVLIRCVLPLPQGMTGDSVQLPVRAPRKPPNSSPPDERDEVDGQVMERILMSLNRMSDDNRR